MSILTHPKYVRRAGDLAWLLWKHGRADLVERIGLTHLIEDDSTPESRAEEFAEDLEKLGPTFVKLGQLLSTRADLLPMEYLEALGKLQDDVEPVPYADVRDVVEEELGMKIGEAFESFDSEPIAAASLGQVHKARLKNGVEVAVKVQRPDVRERMRSDLDALREFARLVDRHTDIGQRYEFAKTLDHFRQMLLDELDYTREAANMRVVRKNLEGFDRIGLAAPLDELCTQRVLTMTYIAGKKVTKLTEVERSELDGKGLADELFKSYLHQILVDGIFHADPHPGNVLLTEEGRLMLLDLGMVARATPRMQGYLLKLMLAIADGEGDRAAEIAIQMGDQREWFEPAEFKRQVSDIVVRQRGATMQHIEMGSIVLKVGRVAAETGIRLPNVLMTVGKAFMNLDKVGSALSEEFDPSASMRRHAMSVMRSRFVSGMKPGALFTQAAETREFLEALPRRVNRLLETLTEEQIQLKIDAIDEHRLMSGFQKIANRITVGLVLASMILGGSILMHSDATWMWWIAAAMFAFALVCGVGVVLTAFFTDDSGPPGPVR